MDPGWVHDPLHGEEEAHSFPATHSGEPHLDWALASQPIVSTAYVYETAVKSGHREKEASIL